ncbi:MAG TPA: FliM/FliN family flagellar motor switch protein [Polyangia bacterium]|nr:FliM/FliN family flagellar motor switch protein [Polyangia bacterium]
MNATTLDLTGCPTVARVDALATARAARVLASLPESWDVALPPLGAVTLTPVGVGDVPADALALAIRRDGVTARLCVATPLAARWVDRVIGGGELFAPVRALGPAERGVLLALLAPLLDPIGWSFVLGPAQAVADAAVVLRVRGAPGAGTMWLQAPMARDGARAVHGPRAARLPVDMGVCLASTTLARGALVDVADADVVLFDGVAHPEAGEAPWMVDLVTGGFRAAARLDSEGRATILRGWQRSDRKDVTMETDETIDSAAAALAAAPVEVVAELGRITLRGDEVLGLAPGVVLGLRVDRTSAVSLRVGGAIWAEGELVNVDGELGVRVTRLLAR